MRLRIKPSCWFKVLWLLAPIAALVIALNKGKVEDDLTSRASSLLNEKGFSWAKPTFDGRDGILHGAAPKTADVEAARQLVENMHGVRIVETDTKLVQSVKPYVWNATKDAKTLTLNGYVSSDEERKNILGMAKGSFPDHELKDELKIGPSDIDKSVWSGRIGYGLSALAGLSKGTVSLNDNQYSISGYAKSLDLYKSLQSKASKPLSNGLELASSKIQPPMASPFTWGMAHKDNRVTITGYASSLAGISAMAAKAKTLFPSATIDNQVVLASGAPDGFDKAQSVGMAQLGKLLSGALNISDQSVHLVGETRDKTIADVARADLSGNMADGFTSKSDIKVLEPVVPNLPPVAAKPIEAPAKPVDTSISMTSRETAVSKFYSWGAKIDERSVVLSGYVPNEKMRRDIIEATRQQMGTYRLVDNMIVAGGAPKDYATAVGHGLGLLSTLGNGDVSLVGRDLTLTGKTGDEAINGRIVTALGNQMVSNFKGVNKVEYVKPAPAANSVIKDILPEVKVDAAIKDLQDTDKVLGAKDCQQLLNSIVRGNAIRFAVGKANIRSESFPVLAKVSFVAKKCEKVKIIIEGHTDSDGSSHLNLNLSSRRAISVVTYLKSLGVNSKQLVGQGYGETRPIADNDTADNKAKNRRIEFRAIDN